MLSQNKAEIIGLLCAEGNYYDKRTSYWEYYKDRQKYYYKKNKRSVNIQFGNFDMSLLKHFQNLLNIEYNYTPKIEEDRVRICRRDVIKDLINYSDYGCLKWHVPQDIIKNKDLSIRFLRGYFEGDGCAKNKLVYCSSNIKGLYQVQLMLKKLGILFTLQGPYFRQGKENEYFVYIRRKSWKKFLKVINPKFKTKTL